MNHVHKSIAFRLLSNTISKSDDFQSRFSSNMTAVPLVKRGYTYLSRATAELTLGF